MKILHCCLAAFYIDNYGYQENILPKMHKLQGLDVKILASTETYIDNAKLGYVKPSSYKTKEGISITRLPYTQYLPHKIAKKLRIYVGLKKELNDFAPDIIFLHDCQFLSITQIAEYKEKHPNTKIYIDSHTDFINSAKGWVSKNILHKIIYRWCAQKIEPYTNKFYGTLPVRSDFLREVYKLPENKIALLELGIDDHVFNPSFKESIAEKTKQELNIKSTDFVIVTGGKIDLRKNIHKLLKVVSDLENKNLKLVIFGKPNEDTKQYVEKYAKSSSIINIGWVLPEQVYNYLAIADVAFFPGTHSVLWEQAVGMGIPCVFKKWDGIQHVDIGGNCIFINEGNEIEIKETLDMLINNKGVLNKLKDIAQTKGAKRFSYSEIAKRAIEVY